MKCPNCGGDIPAQSLTCPYCGTANQEGIAFQEEIQKRIERNKLLKPFLIKQKTPELVQKMLTRMVLILFGINLLLFVVIFLFFLWGEREGKERVPGKGSQAEAYYDTFTEIDEYYYASFLKEAGEMIEMIENGEMPDVTDAEYVVRYGYEALEASQEKTEEIKEEVGLTVNAFFMGYLGLSEEEMQMFRPKEDGSYDAIADSELVQKTGEIIIEKLQEVAK